MAILSGSQAQAQSQSAQFLPPHITLDDLATTFVTSAGHPLEIALNINPAPLPLRIKPAVERAKRPLAPPSIKARRELDVKGNEGSKRRQRWENDRLLSNPYFTAPTAADFVPGPTYPVKVVHYELAHLYNPSTTGNSRKQAKKAQSAQIPKVLKQKLKHARGAIGIVKMLEERIRDSLLTPDLPSTPISHQDEADSWEKLDIDKEIFSEEEGHESDKEYIVFVPKRKVQTPAPTAQTALTTPLKAVPIYHSSPEDPTSPFVRWLVHSIAEYYGLKSWSCAGDDGKGRVAWVEGKSGFEGGLPKLLWVML
ncbi:hypothetical protein DFH27DRAFT_577842 [Peziza echinospora]|nr:hypothetical protein DFH27DRAFT_577842 [Peziza echinospora]